MIFKVILAQTLYNFLSHLFETHLLYGPSLVLLAYCCIFRLDFQNSIVMESSNVSLNNSRTWSSCFRGQCPELIKSGTMSVSLTAEFQ